MGKHSKRRSGGGAATTAGTVFQEETAAYFAVLILAESGAQSPTGLPADVRLVDLAAETLNQVDDLVVGTSAGGRIFVQSKTTIALSKAANSDFAKTVRQFIRQMHSGYVVAGKRVRSLKREFDRLVLAVSPAAPDTVTTILRRVLDKCRTATTPMSLADLERAFNQPEKAALTVLRKHLRRTWREERKSVLSKKDELDFLHLVYVLPLDLRVDGPESNRVYDLLKTVILRESARSGDAWNALVGICRTFGPARAGGDLEYLRAQLAAQRLPLKAVYSYAPDIEALRAYTVTRMQHLSRLSTMRIGTREIKIVRPAVLELSKFAAAGHVAVVGEPGAGKSGCLHDLANGMLGTNTDIIVIAADLIDASSPEAFARDLGIRIGRRLEDVLKNWSGEGNGYLIIDALDAARARVNLRALCAILKGIQQVAPRWKIAASIREYDLRNSDDVQAIFQGDPHLTLHDERFPAVRHLKIDRLDETELSQAAKADPRIAAVLAHASPELEMLLRNPFNLSLLCGLIDRDVTEAELNAVNAQVALLDLYWRSRVDSGDHRLQRLAVLDNAVKQMVEARELRTSRLGLHRQRTLPDPLLKIFCTTGSSSSFPIRLEWNPA